MVELKGTWIFSWEGQGFRSSLNRSGVVEIFLGGFFLSWAGDLTRSYLWPFDHFPMLKTNSINIEHRVKSKLGWYMYTESIKLKNYCIFHWWLDENCYLVYWRGFFLWWERWTNFLLLGDSPHPRRYEGVETTLVRAPSTCQCVTGFARRLVSASSINMFLDAARHYKVLHI